MEINISICVPFCFNFLDSKNRSIINNANKVFRQFLQLSNVINISFFNGYNCKVSIDIIKDKLTRNKLLDRYDALELFLWKGDFVKFHIFLEYKEDDVKKCLMIDELSDSNLKSILETKEVIEEIIFRTAVEELYSFIIDLVICGNISYLGSMSFKKCLLFKNGMYHSYKHGALNDFYNIVELTYRLKWPPLNILPLKVVWSWYKTIPNIDRGISISPLGRAIGVIGFIFNENFYDENNLTLMWALIGLEALYCEKNGGAKKFQIIEKSETILGSSPQSKTFIKKMYNFRSSLIHGEFDIPFKHYKNGIIEQIFFNSMDESNEVALAMLFSTLQFMAKNNIYELSFRVSYYLSNVTPFILKKKKLSIQSL